MKSYVIIAPYHLLPHNSDAAARAIDAESYVVIAPYHLLPHNYRIAACGYVENNRV